MFINNDNNIYICIYIYIYILFINNLMEIIEIPFYGRTLFGSSLWRLQCENDCVNDLWFVVFS